MHVQVPVLYTTDLKKKKIKPTNQNKRTKTLNGLKHGSEEVKFYCLDMNTKIFQDNLQNSPVSPVTCKNSYLVTDKYFWKSMGALMHLFWYGAG